MGALTQDEKDKIRDEAVAQWWKDWFAADYSWDGLTQYQWQGWKAVESKAAYLKYLEEHGLPAGCPNEACQVVPADFDGLSKRTKTRRATLQDYWRDQEHRLEGQESGKLYTIAHLPAKFEDGAESWKADLDHEKWENVSELLRQRIDCGVQTEIKVDFRGDENVTGVDRRSNFRGCVLLTIPTKSEPSSSQVETSRPLHITLRQSALFQTLDFASAIFGSTTNFGLTQFLGQDTNFRAAQFSGGDANFRGVQFSGGDANFRETQFIGGNADFERAKFLGGDANFREAQFSGGITNFRSAEFTGRYTNFFDARLAGKITTFTYAKFHGDEIYFDEVEFSGEDTRFGGVSFNCERTSFQRARFFSKHTSFWGALFSANELSFIGAQFRGADTSFINAKFNAHISFADARFNGQVVFRNVKFPSVIKTKDAFRGTEFLGPSDFSRTEFNTDPENLSTSDEYHFPFNALAHANFKDQLILTQKGDRYAQNEFNRALKSTREAFEQNTNEGEIEAHYVALESGCTTLKRAMEDISDKNRAQRYFKFELFARQKRPSTSTLVRVFTWLYGLTADYGGSIGRPLLALFIAWAVFTLGYLWNAWAVEVETAKPWQMLWGAMDFSATHIFRPLFIWSKNAASGDSNWVAQYHDQLSAGGWLTVKIFATIQSFLSIILLFLFGLATKRKFQMS